MKCSRCGSEVVEGVSFCPKCGNYMKQDQFGNNFNNQHNEFSSYDTNFVNNMNFNNQNMQSKQFNYGDQFNQSSQFNQTNQFEQSNQSKHNQFFSVEQTSLNNSYGGYNTNNFNNTRTVSNNSSFGQDQKNLSKKKPKKKISMDLVVCLVFLGIWIVLISFVIKSLKVDYYFDGREEQTNSVASNSDNTGSSQGGNENTTPSENENEFANYKGVSKSGYNGVRTSSDLTSVIYDNQYFKQTVLTGKGDVLKLIAADSEKQKSKCSQEIVNIENKIVNNYGITAVNLCEMDITFAKELRNVAAYIYNNFPNAHGYLTNLTLANVGSSATYMAAFMPLFTFATSKSSSGYPVGIKTQIILNTKYFLNPSKIKNSVDYGAKTGYFPKGATRSSAVAHEFGHYLSYVAMLNYYKTSDMTFVSAGKYRLMYTVYGDFNEGNFSNQVIKEAYNEYTKTYGAAISYDAFRGSISTYALAKDESGEYIYDETIAEAFHDVYLNGSSAAPASTYIVNALKKYL